MQIFKLKKEAVLWTMTGGSLLAFVIFLLLNLRDSRGTSSESREQLKSRASDGSLPGIEKFDRSLLRQFDEMRKTRGKEYRPRTRHLRADGWAKYINRLFLETNPYLLQHAHNPVNWYPWGDDAFETAKKLKRPVLLSVGYSTCHWCHVMEEESFEDEEIARVMNENYISIKVDREERPDVDAIYMSAVQAMTGSGGWPMTVWLTPDRKPFFGGTYFPARDGDRGAPTGFLTLIRRIKNAYDSGQERVVKATSQLTAAIQEILKPQKGNTLPKSDILFKAGKEYKARFDYSEGGISSRMKFPSSLPNRFLLRFYKRTWQKEYLKMATLTLEKMASGGMYDQVGGGFHRYSTDPKWLVPHFEKMLYDNALLVPAYLEAYQVTKDKNFERIAREILRYIERDMTSPDGAFYCATDADSPTPSGRREEGWFFTWTPKEIDEVLGKKESLFIKTYYNVTKSGNFEGRSILHTPQPIREIASRFKLKDENAMTVLQEAKEKLYQTRLKRPPPIRDEKILTAWNGLMISAYAHAGLLLGESQYTERAIRAANFILKNLYEKGRLKRSFKDGKAHLNAYLEDYAFFIAALLDLYETTNDVQWIKYALTLDEVLEKHYEDKVDGGFFMTSDDHEALLVRGKPADDGAVPSGNSIALLNLLRLHEFTTKDGYRKRLEMAFKAFSKTLEIQPVALSEMLSAIDFYLDKPKEIVLVAKEKKEIEPFLEVLRQEFLPNRVLMSVTEGKELESQSAVIPLLRGKIAQKGKATAYVCERGICEFPTSDPAVFEKQIKKLEKSSGGS